MSFKESLEKFGSEVEHQASLFGTALVRESVQHPINGVVELASKLTNHKLPELHIVEEKGPAHGLADTLGGMAGKTIDFLLVNKLAHGKLAPTAEMTNTEIYSRGYLYGAGAAGVFTPVETTGDDFWSKRFQNTIYGGASYGVGSVIGVRALKRLLPDSTAGDVTNYSAKMAGLSSYDTLRAVNSSPESATPVNEPAAVVPAHAPLNATRNTLTVKDVPDLEKVAGFALPNESDIDGTQSKSGIVEASAAPESKPASQGNQIPAERVGLNGAYDQSGLAKRVDREFDAIGLNKYKTVWVAQDGNSVVLEGREGDKQELAEMVKAATMAGLAVRVSNQVTVVETTR